MKQFDLKHHACNTATRSEAIRHYYKGVHLRPSRQEDSNTKNRRLKARYSLRTTKKENSFIYRISEKSTYAVVSRVQVTVEVTVNECRVLYQE
jgi:hypothetical protein